MIPTPDRSPPGAAARDARPVVIIAGPTASGKSALAVAAAKEFDGVIVNADAIQVYRELSILTARPDAAALRRAPHRLYGVLTAADPCTAGRWRNLALAEIAAIHEAGRLPILVGGTGLYLRALVRGLSPIPAIPTAIRAAGRRRLEEIGAEAFHRELQARDPETAARVAPGDRQRLIRAWEVVEFTGRSQTAWHREQANGSPPHLRFRTLALMPARAVLAAACDARYAHMLENGAVEEARALAALDLPPDSPAMKAVGIPPLLRYLAGEIALAEARDLGQRDTRRYAKRQATWIRHQADTDRAIGEQYSESLDQIIFPYISDFVLTA